ncbi:MAG: ATP-dependent helicase, partial [Proteobacteria bacterium]|nr:ATP-dependent helicase [Pseudomonadota bacterium]
MTGNAFIISHSLMIDETYVAGLREALGEFRPRAVLILDEAHHAAPASGARYAIDSQFTKAIRDLASRFEHRLFLSATPHNGHSNSFSALLEMLDPQRFTRGVPAKPKDLEQIMVRRLKSDLRRIDARTFPLRRVEPITIDGLDANAPELVLAEMLSDYRALREKRISRMGARKAAQARIVFAGLQHRLLSSAAAFASTLTKHKQTLERQLTGDLTDPLPLALPTDGEDTAEFLLDEDEAADELIAYDDRTLETAAAATAPEPGREMAEELDAVQEMLALAVEASRGADARVRWILNWIGKEFAPAGIWSNRRLLIFTEWETTRRWLERRLKEGIASTEDAENRIEVFSGA